MKYIYQRASERKRLLKEMASLKKRRDMEKVIEPTSLNGVKVSVNPPFGIP